MKRYIIALILVLLLLDVNLYAQQVNFVTLSTSDSIGIDLDNDGMDLWLYPAYFREGPSIIFSVVGDTLTVSGDGSAIDDSIRNGYEIFQKIDSTDAVIDSAVGAERAGNVLDFCIVWFLVS
jgi:hypothetical protein